MSIFLLTSFINIQIYDYLNQIWQMWSTFTLTIIRIYYIKPNGLRHRQGSLGCTFWGKYSWERGRMMVWMGVSVFVALDKRSSWSTKRRTALSPPSPGPSQITAATQDQACQHVWELTSVQTVFLPLLSISTGTAGTVRHCFQIRFSIWKITFEGRLPVLVLSAP